MKKIIAPMILGILATFTLYACMTSSDGGSSVSLAWDLPVKQLNQTSHVITTQDIEYSCEGGKAVGDTNLETQDYDLTGGKLYLWDANSCDADVYSGTSTTIIGSWSLDAFVESPIPAAVRPSNCNGAFTAESDSTGLINASASATISATNIHLTLSGDPCFGQLFDDEFSSSNTIQVTSSSCSTLQIKAVQSGQTATLSTSFSNNNLEVDLKSGTKTCSVIEPLIPNIIPSCPAGGSSTSDSAFAACIETTPFASVDADAKAAVNSSRWSSPVMDAIRNSNRHLRL